MDVCAEEQKEKLAELTLIFAANALSVNTRSSYATHVRQYLGFCLTFGHEPLPATDTVLSQFFVFQSQTCSPSSLATYTSGIRAFHLENGFSWPHISSRTVVHRTVQGIKRAFGTPPTPKLAISLEHLMEMRKHLDFEDPNDVMWWAAALVAFFLSLRKDNVTCEKEGSFNAKSNLCRGDFAPQHGWDSIMSGPLWVRLRYSKTNQNGGRVHTLPLIPNPGSPLCPVTAVAQAFGLDPRCTTGMSAFKVSKGDEFFPMTHAFFVGRFKSLIRAIGLDPDAYSGHSFRRGAATLAFTLTDRHELIKFLGDWKSDAYLGYNQMSVETKCLLPTLMSLHAARMVA